MAYDAVVIGLNDRQSAEVSFTLCYNTTTSTEHLFKIAMKCNLRQMAIITKTENLFTTVYITVMYIH